MACYYVEQSIYSVPTVPSIEWFHDYVLEQPVLYLPLTDSVLCPDNYPWTSGSGSGIFLEWNSVPNAQYYIVQWCKNSSFHGPTLRAVQVSAPTLQYELLLGSEYDIIEGDQLYWRVMAFNDYGGVSEKSEHRWVKYKCQTSKIDGGGGRGGGSGSGSENKSFCEMFNVAVAIKGPHSILCCDKTEWNSRFSWMCKDSDGNDIVTLTAGTWSIEQVVAGVGGHVITSQTKNKVLISTECEASNNFILKLRLQFLHIPTGTTFYCDESKEIHCDCGQVKKPWNNFYDPPLQQYLDPTFTKDPAPSSYTGSTSATDKYVLGSSSYIAVGGVFVTEKVSINEPEQPDTLCDAAKMMPGPREKVKMEAAIQLPIPWPAEYIKIGCGLKADTNNALAIKLRETPCPGIICGANGVYIDDTSVEVANSSRITDFGLSVVGTSPPQLYLDLYGQALDLWRNCAYMAFSDFVEIPIQETKTLNLVTKQVVSDVYCAGGAMFKTYESIVVFA